uniref:ABC transporter domain-containing protein n=1 Tax=Physcomitrium patens TaxID=3218 RepID=A0A7I4ACZ0_PHYPA
MNGHRADPEAGTQAEEPLRVTAKKTQANALFRKNLTFQKRNWRTNCCLVLFPALLCILLVIIQVAVNGVFNGSDFKCGCKCVPDPNGGPCIQRCGLEYSNNDQAVWCGMANPTPWPALLQIPEPQYRATRNQSPDLTQDPSCRVAGTCAVTIPYTGTNRTTADIMAGLLLGIGATNASSLSSTSVDNLLYSLSKVVLGGDTILQSSLLIETAFTSSRPISVLRPSCAGALGDTANFTVDVGEGYVLSPDLACLETKPLWRDNVSVVNDLLYKGYRRGNPAEEIGEYPAAFDFRNTNPASFDVNVIYNDTYANRTTDQPSFVIRVSRSLNMAAQAFLRYKQGGAAELPLLFVKEFPKPNSQLRLDFSSLLGPLFYMWVLGLLFPVVLTALVYEKEHHLRMMMKMHGLGDSAYWTITYVYYLVLFCIYMICFIIFGSLVRLNFFTKNDYGIQALFYFLYVNMIISLSFLVSTAFRSVKTATVFGYIYVFGSGLLGAFLYENFIVDLNTSNIKGMQWSDLKDNKNKLQTSLIILAVEAIVFMLLALYLDQVVSSDNGINKHPLFFLNFKRKGAKPEAALTTARSRRFSGSSRAMAYMNAEDAKAIDRPDVAREREQVEELAAHPSKEYPIVCDNLKRVYPARDGNPPKYAVRGFSLAVPKGECFGILGPNGAGKTSSINMMIGFLKPSSGTAYIQGMDILTDMDRIYSCMGVCPQHDLLWGQLTGREHLLFYGRLKNLKGADLNSAVESSLRSVNLWDNGVADKQCRTYSGGMKRRLSVAVSLIGKPQVVYMDEPSTGLDPASRYNLWNVVKQSKKDRAIILTTHSMEEAEALCDRLGIFVNGELQCIGNAKELTARYGGLYVLTITTPPSEELEVIELVKSLTPNAKKIYGLSGTQKFELPKTEVSVGTVFSVIEQAKDRLHVEAWGLSDTTLEDVFIKVARSVEGGAALQ